MQSCPILSTLVWTWHLILPFGLPWQQRLTRGLLYLLALTIHVVAFADTASAYLRLPPMPRPPEIDGRIYQQEWRMASPSFGSVSRDTGLMSRREVHHFIGYDDQFLYIAQQSELPPPPMRLSDEDTIFVSFGLEKTTTIVFDQKGHSSTPSIHATSLQQKGYLEFEAAIPWSLFGIASLQYGTEYRLQIGRNFQNLDEQATWSAGETGTFVPEKDIPVAGFKTLGRRWKGTGYEIQWSAANPGLPEAQVKVDALLVATDVPRSLNVLLTPAEGQETTALLRGILQPMERRLEAKLVNAQDGNLLYQRDFSWNAEQGLAFVDPDPPFVLDFAFYPTYGFVKAKVTCSDNQKLAQLAGGTFEILGEDGKVYSTQPIQPDNLQEQWNIPELPEGRYDLVANLIELSGKKHEARRDFLVRHFPWQGLNLGAQLKVLPPYIPLSFKHNLIQALQTSFHLGGGLWDVIEAQGENLLASPVSLQINGCEAQIADDPKLVEQTDARIVLESSYECEDVNLVARQEYDFDGFCKVTLRLSPKVGATALSGIKLDIPLKSGYMQFVSTLGNGMRNNEHKELPQKDGLLWDSLEGAARQAFHTGFRPYIWLGEIYKGLAFVCESPKNWERAQNTASQEILREGDTTILRLHLANKPFTLDSDREYILAFQPSPTRPQDPHWRNQHGSLYNCQNPKEALCFMTGLNNYARFLCMRVDDGICQVPNDDWSFIDYLTAANWKTETEVRRFSQDYLTRNDITEENFSAWSSGEPEPGDDLVTRMYQGCRFWKNTQINLVYMNPRACCPSWPERDMFVDEWFGGAWRPAKSFRDEYSCHPDANYCDFLLWNSLRLMPKGWYGLYLDNLYDAYWDDPALNPYGHDCGPYWPIFKIRELVRRAATVSYEQGFLCNGYPLLMIHETDCNVVPWLSLASHSLDWEMNFGDRPFPERFSDAYIKTNTLGTQTGASPMVILNTTGSNGSAATDSLLALTFAYGLLSQHDSGLRRTERFFTLRDYVWAFGYGAPATAVFPCWDKANPVRQLTENVRCTFVRRPDGEALLLIGNLAPEYATAQFALPEHFTATDIEGEKLLPLDDENRLAVPVAGYNCKVIHLKP